MLRVASCFAFIAAALFLLPGSQAKEKWLPITAEELAMKDNPAEPGAQAMLLYREVMSNDADSYETHYYRIKILSEEGEKWGDVEIPFVKDLFRISDIKARTIRPDGSVVPFDGKVYENLVVKTKGLRYLARIFTLPEVHRGSIIEYKYRRGWSQYLLFATNWTIQDQLFTRKINLRRRPYTGRQRAALPT